jgi:uncharacterized protein (DUF1697 family)
VTAYVALLGGINVGGRTLRSAALRDIAEGCGFDDVSTFIQSGNVLFRSPDGAARVGARLHDAILEASGIDTRVAMRTAAQLQDVVVANPFLDRAHDPTKVSVTFLFDGATPTLSALDPAAYAPDEVVVIGREAYLHTPNGMGRTKLVPAVARKLGLAGTTRNWRSTTKLAALAAAIGRT